MKKTLLLSMLIALIAPLTAQALMTNDEVLSYAAMPLAVSNVCDVRGVQNDQVASLVGYMDQANVSPQGFIEVFRYVPVGLVFNGGRNPDFVDWVGSQVNQGVVGDELVTVMERRLTSYGNVVNVSRPRHYRPRVYETVYERDYVPVAVQHYCERDLLDRFALIDMPVAVTNVVELGVPVARVGGLVVQLNLGYVSPLQTVEVLRYSPAALLTIDDGQPDFVQYVYTERVSGLNGYDLARVIDRRFTDYGVPARIDLAPPVYYSQNAYVPSVVTNYVAPIDAAYVPPIVRTRVASYAPARGSYVAPQVVAQAPSPQVQRLLEQRGNAVVMNPAQARREIAHEARRENGPPRVATAVTAAPAFVPPPVQQAHGRGHIVAGPPVVATHDHGHGREHQMKAPVYAQPVPTPRPDHVAVQHGNGHAHMAAPARAQVPVMHPAPVIKERGRPHAMMQPAQPVQAPPPARGHVKAAPPAPVQAPPPPQHGNGKGHGQKGKDQ